MSFYPPVRAGSGDSDRDRDRDILLIWPALTHFGLEFLDNPKIAKIKGETRLRSTFHCLTHLNMWVNHATC